jgi:hypothetical protein
MREFEHRRVELPLERRLARIFASDRANRPAIEEYETQILPASREAYQLYLESFQQQRAAWPQVLAARTYFQSPKADAPRGHNHGEGFGASGASAGRASDATGAIPAAVTP